MVRQKTSVLESPVAANHEPNIPVAHEQERMPQHTKKPNKPGLRRNDASSTPSYEINAKNDERGYGENIEDTLDRLSRDPEPSPKCEDKVLGAAKQRRENQVGLDVYKRLRRIEVTPSATGR